MIDIQLNSGTINIQWENIKNIYDKDVIYFNGEPINNFYLRNISNRSFNGFFISFNGITMLSTGNNVIITLSGDYDISNIKTSANTIYNTLTNLVYADAEYDINCSSQF